jgi:hypothetical protein
MRSPINFVEDRVRESLFAFFIAERSSPGTGSLVASLQGKGLACNGQVAGRAGDAIAAASRDDGLAAAACFLAAVATPLWSGNEVSQQIPPSLHARLFTTADFQPSTE